jgi:hypothetical protein
MGSLLNDGLPMLPRASLAATRFAPEPAGITI